MHLSEHAHVVTSCLWFGLWSWGWDWNETSSFVRLLVLLSFILWFWFVHWFCPLFITFVYWKKKNLKNTINNDKANSSWLWFSFGIKGRVDDVNRVTTHISLFSAHFSDICTNFSHENPALVWLLSHLSEAKRQTNGVFYNVPRHFVKNSLYSRIFTQWDTSITMLSSWVTLKPSTWPTCINLHKQRWALNMMQISLGKVTLKGASVCFVLKHRCVWEMAASSGTV